MASIVDSFREVTTDKLAFLKLAILSIPVYFSYQVYLQSRNDFTGFFWLCSITIFLLFSALLEIINNGISESNTVLPSFNPFQLVFTGFKGIIAIGPLALITCLLANYVCSFINIIPWFDITLKTIIWFVAASIITASFLMFSTRKRILDAYNLKVIFQKSGDLIVALIFFIIQLVIMNIPTSAFLGYVLIVLFGYGPIFNFFLALVLVFNVAVTGHYMAQVHYETITYDKNIM